MEADLFGVPLVFWGVICLAISVIWVFAWPRHKATSPGWRFFVIRWFHAFVWVLLALAAFIAAFAHPGGAAAARVVALLSLVTYLIFMVTLFTSKSP